MPVSLACDLLDLYFADSPSVLVHLSTPYILSHVFERHSILHLSKPRQCSPALLASALWVIAQTSGAAVLIASPLSRSRICQKLLDVTVNCSSSFSTDPSYVEASHSFPIAVINRLALGRLCVTLDEVATYIHLATVFSTSQYKAASLMWWNCAWALARELPSHYR